MEILQKILQLFIELKKLFFLSKITGFIDNYIWYTYHHQFLYRCAHDSFQSKNLADSPKLYSKFVADICIPLEFEALGGC